MDNKNLFQIAKENANFKECEGCGETKPISSFKKRNKYCTGCPYVKKIREKYSSKEENIESNLDINDDIDSIDLDSFFSEDF